MPKGKGSKRKGFTRQISLFLIRIGRKFCSLHKLHLRPQCWCGLPSLAELGVVDDHGYATTTLPLRDNKNFLAKFFLEICESRQYRRPINAREYDAVFIILPIATLIPNLFCELSLDYVTILRLSMLSTFTIIIFQIPRWAPRSCNNSMSIYNLTFYFYCLSGPVSPHRRTKFTYRMD